jgi:hypothetical protein
MIYPHARRTKKSKVRMMLIWVLASGIVLTIVEGFVLHRAYEPRTEVEESSE